MYISEAARHVVECFCCCGCVAFVLSATRVKSSTQFVCFLASPLCTRYTCIRVARMYARMSVHEFRLHGDCMCTVMLMHRLRAIIGYKIYHVRW